MRRLLWVLFAFAFQTAHAEGGMWPFDNLPTADLQAHYQFAPDARWIDHVMHASVRLGNGCSGSLVSAKGLVLTNHHCALECIQELSSQGRDFVRDGFIARKPEEELRCPGLQVSSLRAISDVTKDINAQSSGKQGRDFQRAVDAATARVVARCKQDDPEHTKCDVVTLYHGGQYKLYRYRLYSDIRLVFAPEMAIGQFGGDPDNFNFPRYGYDMSLMRAYVDGKPAENVEHFVVSVKGVHEGELTITSGNPGRTERELTVAQLERLRIQMALETLPRVAEARGLLIGESDKSPEMARVLEDDLFSAENYRKVLIGEEQALLDGRVMEEKAREEARLAEFMRRNPSAVADFGNPWQAIAAAEKRRSVLEPEMDHLENFGRRQSREYGFAIQLVRAAKELEKPNDQRLPEYTDARLTELKEHLFSTAPIYPEQEELWLTYALKNMREAFGPDDGRVKQLLGIASPAERAHQLVTGSRLNRIDVRRRLFEGGSKAIAESDDPLIAFARQLDPLARQARDRFEDQVVAVETQNAQKIAAARFAMLGTSIPPDATSSPRLSFGVVRGWREGDHEVKPFTDFEGLYGRATGSAPFNLPARWLSERNRLDPKQRFNFVTTNDVVGGNSGSPLINRNAEVIGLVFDGNIESLGGSFFFDDGVNRTVSVDAGAIVAALRGVYHVDAIADEMTQSN